LTSYNVQESLVEVSDCVLQSADCLVIRKPYGSAISHQEFGEIGETSLLDTWLDEIPRDAPFSIFNRTKVAYGTAEFMWSVLMLMRSLWVGLAQLFQKLLVIGLMENLWCALQVTLRSTLPILRKVVINVLYLGIHIAIWDLKMSFFL
jgi:hypothetical protein